MELCCRFSFGFEDWFQTYQSDVHNSFCSCLKSAIFLSFFFFFRRHRMRIFLLFSCLTYFICSNVKFAQNNDNESICWILRQEKGLAFGDVFISSLWFHKVNTKKLKCYFLMDIYFPFSFYSIFTWIPSNINALFLFFLAQLNKRQ